MTSGHEPRTEPLAHNEIRGSVSGPTVQTGVHIGDNYFHQPAPVPMEALEQLDLAATDIDWWESVAADAEVSWTPPFGHGWRPLLIAGILWLAALPIGLMLGLVVADYNRESLGALAFYALLPLPYLLLIWAIPRRARKGRILLLVLLYYTGGALIITSLAIFAQPWTTILFLLCSGGYVVVPLASRFKRFRAQDNVFTPEFRRFNVFGVPAPAHIYAAGVQPPFDPGKRMYAVRLTDHLFGKYLVHIPAVRIYHQVACRRFEGAVVDHAVLCGRRLVLIDSIIWPADHYSVDGSGYIMRDGYPFPDGALVLSNAVRMVQSLLVGVEVRGIVLLWPDQAGRMMESAWNPETKVAVLAAESFIKQVGSWLSENPTTIDRNVLLAVRDLTRS